MKVTIVISETNIDMIPTENGKVVCVTSELKIPYSKEQNEWLHKVLDKAVASYLV